MGPGELARPYGLSSQAIRNYEDRGVLPPAERTPGGHRRYGERHRLALAAFLTLVPALGHATGADLVAAAHRGHVDDVLVGLDRAHAQLASDRETLALVAAAVDRIDPVLTPAPTEAPVPIGVVAHRIGVRPATIRAWERAGILRPVRDPVTGHRRYGPADLRDARLAHQLRRGGSLLRQIAVVVGEIRDHHTGHQLRQTLDDAQASLRRRGLALVAGTAALHDLLASLDSGRDSA